MKNINDYINGTLRQHADLVSTGIDSPTALEIVTQGLQSKHLIECLEQLKVWQAEELIEAMRKNVYSFKGHKSTYAYAGCTKYGDTYQFHFVDNVFEIDSLVFTAEELEGRIQSDLLRAIKEVSWTCTKH